MTSPEFQKVLSGRRVTIPESLAKKHNIKEGDIVMISEEKNFSSGIHAITIIPCDIVPRTDGKNLQIGMKKQK